MNVLHIASFSGNIGDNANHMGFRPWFEQQIGTPVVWTNLEIREFYWGERQWDQELVDAINTHDMVVIGGGNYFELWVENSPTGTSIAIEPSLFEQISIPIFFNALGVDPGQGVPEVCRERFTNFLDLLTSSKQYLVSVRNDGAMENLVTHIGFEYAQGVHSLPDHGFFVPMPSEAPVQMLPQNKGAVRIAINLASDMAEIRFAGFKSQSDFSREMAFVLNALSIKYPSAEFYLVPHIYRDIEIISEVIGFLSDRLRRTRVAVAPFGSGDEAAKRILAIYYSADLIMGMRFHSNVCPMALGRQVLGLSSYTQIENLYSGLGQRDRIVNISHPGFANQAVQLAAQMIEGGQDFASGPQQVQSQVGEMRSAFEIPFKDWLNQG